VGKFAVSHYFEKEIKELWNFFLQKAQVSLQNAQV
jgi:hypothetical protein